MVVKNRSGMLLPRVMGKDRAPLLLAASDEADAALSSDHTSNTALVFGHL